MDFIWHQIFLKIRPTFPIYVIVRQPILVADQAGDVDLDDGGQDEHIVLAGKLRGRAVNGMQYE